MKILTLHDGKTSLIDDLRSMTSFAESKDTIVEVSDLIAVVDALSKERDIDLILISIARAKSKCARWNGIIRARGVKTPIVFISDTSDLTAVAGAVLDRLVVCPTSTASGRTMLSTIITGIRVQTKLGATDGTFTGLRGTVDGKPVKMPHLTKRQMQVLNLIVKGMSNKDIARELSLAEGTIKIHSIAIYRELGVANRTQAALRAKQLFAA